jgi:hypothetical protein
LFLRKGIVIAGVADLPAGFLFDFCPAYFILAGRIEFGFLYGFRCLVQVNCFEIV